MQFTLQPGGTGVAAMSSGSMMGPGMSMLMLSWERYALVSSSNTGSMIVSNKRPRIFCRFLLLSSCSQHYHS
jgi:hypothetical protein